MKVYFGRRSDYFEENKYWIKIKENLTPIYECNNAKEALRWAYTKISEEIGMRVYYTKFNFSQKDGWAEMDFGSHSLFFLFYELTDDDWKELL